MKVRVVALGEPSSGDDGVGIEVARALAGRGIDVVVARDASAIFSALEGADEVVVVDAVLSSSRTPGEVLELPEGDLARREARPLSSHGIGVGQAIRTARALGFAGRVRLVGVTIAGASHGLEGLSPEVARAVPEAAARVVALLGEPT